MRLHNTLTKQIEDFEQPNGQPVKLYSCGPTVYDHSHIGNLRSFIFADTLRRGLAAGGHDTLHIMNFTDVDDKTIGRSRQRYPDLKPMAALRKLTGHYGEVFLKDTQAVGNDTKALTFVKATDSIPAMQQLVRRLHQDGFAYIADDGVYFSIDAYKRSGKTYGQLTDITDSSTSEARIQNDEYDKASIHDFALWKLQKPDEPAWDFELAGKNLTGRPGWHLECSAMSQAALGQPFDIHTGGVDLIFPHHENEIAQSTAGQADLLYARFFVHNEHLLVDGQKMSKSLDNFYTLEDIVAKGFDPLAFRLLVLQSHYRSQAHFSWTNLAAAQTRLKELRAMAVLRWQPRAFTHDAGTFALEDVPQVITEFLANDLSTPEALAFLSQVTTQLLAVHIEKDMVDHFEIMLRGLDDLLGLNLSGEADISARQKELIKRREEARAKQDWQQSDNLRDQLAAQGIAINDAAHGVIWFRL